MELLLSPFLSRPRTVVNTPIVCSMPTVACSKAGISVRTTNQYVWVPRPSPMQTNHRKGTGARSRLGIHQTAKRESWPSKQYHTQRRAGKRRSWLLVS